MSFGLGTIVPLAAFVAYVVLLSVVGSAPRSPMRRPLVAYLLAMAAWSLFSFMAHLNSPLLSPVRWLRLMGIGLSFAPWGIFCFTTAFLGMKNQRRWLRLTLVVGLLIAVMSSMTGWVVQEARVMDGRLEYEFGAGLVIAVLYTYSILILSLVHLVRAYRRTRDLEIRNRIAYPTLGIALILVGLQTNFTVLGQYASDIGFNLINALLLTYAISRYHLADIYTGFRSGIAITMTAVTVAAMYTALVLILQVLLQMSIGSSGLVAALVTSFFVAVMLQPLRNSIQRLVERLLGSRPYDYQHILLEAGQAINQSIALDDIVVSLQKLLSREMRVKQSFLLILSPERHAYLPAGNIQEVDHDLPSFASDSPLAQELKSRSTTLSIEELNNLPLSITWERNKKMLQGMEARLLVPFSARGEMVGILVMGPKTTGFSYTEEDKHLLSTMANHIAAALDNVRLYSESQEACQSLLKAQEGMLRAERLRTLGELASSTAHDFNNALTTIITRTQLAMEDAPSEKLRKDLAVVEQAGLDAAHIVRRLRFFTTDNTQKDTAPIDVNEAIRSALEMAQPRLKEASDRSRASVNVVLKLSASKLVEANATNLREVFTNIIFNAIDAMPSGGQLTIESRDAGHGLEISFQDTGVGMDPEVQQHIFEPFYTTKKGKGTGLGLTICQKIITDCSGSIIVHSAPLQGSEFIIRLPATDRTRQVSESSTPLPQVSQTVALVVDDEPSALESLAEILLRGGCLVYSARSGTEALRLLDERHYDIVFTDLGMGDVSGFEVAQQVKKRSPNSPVVLVTGWDIPLDEVTKYPDIQEIVYKPFQKNEIQALLSRLLNSSAAGPQQLLTVGQLRLDLQKFELKVNDKQVLLTATEFDLLRYLMEHQGQVISTQRLLTELWKYPADAGSSELVRWHMKNLRDKLALVCPPSIIQNIPRRGYILA